MKYTSLIENALAECVAESREESGILNEAMRYALLDGGKRLRGNLVIMFCELFGGKKETALPLACAIEMVHAHSLVHDDLPCMDNDDIRRGKPSCHKKYGEAIALLAGDALLNDAYMYIAYSTALSDIQKVNSIRAIGKCTGEQGMLCGQVLDKLYENKAADEEAVERIHSKKTGALILCSCLLGLFAAGKFDNESMAVAKIYADALGSAFQITDDILDATGKTEVIGKPAGSDGKNGKNTFVAVNGIEDAREKAKQYTNMAINSVKVYGNNANDLIDVAKKMLERKS